MLVCGRQLGISEHGMLYTVWWGAGEPDGQRASKPSLLPQPSEWPSEQLLSMGLPPTFEHSMTELHGGSEAETLTVRTTSHHAFLAPAAAAGKSRLRSAAGQPRQAEEGLVMVAHAYWNPEHCPGEGAWGCMGQMSSDAAVAAWAAHSCTYMHTRACVHEEGRLLGEASWRMCVCASPELLRVGLPGLQASSWSHVRAGQRAACGAMPMAPARSRSHPRPAAAAARSHPRCR